MASARIHPVSDSATPFMKFTRPSLSVVITASPMLDERDVRPLAFALFLFFDAHAFRRLGFEAQLRPPLRIHRHGD